MFKRLAIFGGLLFALLAVAFPASAAVPTVSVGAAASAAARPAPMDAFTNATLTISPNPTVFTDSNEYFTFSGCGYDPDAGGVVFYVSGPSALSFFGGPTDANGCLGADGNGLAFNGFVTGPGTYSAEADQQYQHGQTIHNVDRAMEELVVTAP
jgi:hypothetical protein